MRSKDNREMYPVSYTCVHKVGPEISAVRQLAYSLFLSKNSQDYVNEI